MAVPKATGSWRLSIPLLLSSFAIPIVLLLSAACAPARHAAPTDVPKPASQAPAASTPSRPSPGASSSPAATGAPAASAAARDDLRAAAIASADADQGGDEPEGVEDVTTEDDVVEGEAAVPAPHDDLAVNPPLPTEEEIERERVLATQQAPAYDIPMVVNEKVTAWIDFYTGPHKEKFRASLVRSGRYLPMIQTTFAAAGIPQDLAYMAHVESAFKSRAYSRAKAKGMFQFISETGRRYGLSADNWTDQRSDPEKSARAAAAYLTDLHAEFGDWYLALAAYNAGEGKIRKAIALTGATDFWTIAKSKTIRNETKNYVPAILAATMIAKDPAKYGLEYTPDAPLAYDVAEVRGCYDLAKLSHAAGMDPDTLRDLNPELRRGCTPPGRTTSLRVPSGSVETTIAALATIPASTTVVADRHVVRKGETLGTIARKYSVSVASIQRANRMGTTTTLHVGRSLAIPGLTPVEVAAVPAVLKTSERAHEAHATSASTYRVCSGDTLSSIARHFGCSPDAIAKASGIAVTSTIRAGQTLSVPGKATTVARADAPDPAQPAVHTVRSGETLWNIAERYRTSVDRLCDLNEISENDPLYPGRRLTVR